jgi:hypothetical protein
MADTGRNSSRAYCDPTSPFSSFQCQLYFLVNEELELRAIQGIGLDNVTESDVIFEARTG